MILILFSISAGILGCSKLISGSILLRERIAASLLNASRSAPTNPWVTFAIDSRLTSSVSGMPRVWINRMSNRPCSSGIPISISLSNLPGRLSAGSIAFGLFVAPMTTSFPLDCMPSINVRSCETTRFSTSPETSSLFGAMESISSMKMIEGAFSSASLKTSLRRSSLSP